ncbi:MAG: glycosyltransferase [bacterium]
MKIYLINDSIRGIVSNEETFWSVISENLRGARGIAMKDIGGSLSEFFQREQPDIVISNSIFGNLETPQKTKKIVLLQDDFIAMKKRLPWDWKRIVKAFMNFGDPYVKKAALQREAISNADRVVVVSNDIARSYGLSDYEVIPIGTDSQLFSPTKNREELRKKYGIPTDAIVKIFIGSTHLVKGFDILETEIKNDSKSFYILVLKDKYRPILKLSNVKVFQRIDQKTLAELMNCADVCVGRSRVETLWLGPIEAMFCGVPVDVTPVGIFADWKPANLNPRQEAFEIGLDRETMIKRWESLIHNIVE